METREIILKSIKDAAKPLKGAEISAATGIEKKEVDKTIKILLKEEKIYSPVRCLYDIRNK